MERPLTIPGNNDLTAIQIITGNIKISIFNIYNDCTHSATLTQLCQYMEEVWLNIGLGANNHILWCGDFNKHHPLWDDKADEHLFTPQALREAAILIGLLADEGLEMALLKGVPTLKHMVTKLYSCKVFTHGATLLEISCGFQSVDGC